MTRIWRRDDIINLSGRWLRIFLPAIAKARQRFMPFENTPSGSYSLSIFLLLYIRSSITLLPAHSTLITQHTLEKCEYCLGANRKGALWLVWKFRLRHLLWGICEIADRARKSFKPRTHADQLRQPRCCATICGFPRPPAGHHTSHGTQLINLSSGLDWSATAMCNVRLCNTNLFPVWGNEGFYQIST